MQCSSCTVCNVKVKFIRPQFENLKTWQESEDNVYIGRRGVVFIDKERYPKHDSKWANPYKISKTMSREESIERYEKYIREKIEKDPTFDIETLRGKNLGCWCAPDPCHGDVLKRILEESAGFSTSV